MGKCRVCNNMYLVGKHGCCSDGCLETLQLQTAGNLGGRFVQLFVALVGIGFIIAPFKYDKPWWTFFVGAGALKLFMKMTASGDKRAKELA
jgi:hypothetical protein